MIKGMIAGGNLSMGSQTVLTYTEPVRGNRFNDLTGRQFGRLTAIRLSGKKAKDGSYYWLCRCECGSETAVSSNKLLQGKTVSCGCYGQKVRLNSRTYVGGTCLEIIKSSKVPKNNTSGIKGVSPSRGQWMVKISFARRQFFLGRYHTLAEAVSAYHKAEALRGEVLDELDVLQERAVDVLAERLKTLRTEIDPS